MLHTQQGCLNSRLQQLNDTMTLKCVVVVQQQQHIVVSDYNILNTVNFKYDLYV